jgi:hypothetical protein
MRPSCFLSASLCASVVDASKNLHHRDTENTEVTQRTSDLSSINLTEHDIQRANYRNHVGYQVSQAKLLQRLKIN